MGKKRIILSFLFIAFNLTIYAIDYVDYNNKIRNILDSTLNQEFSQGVIIVRIKYDSTTHLINDVYLTSRDKEISKFLEKEKNNLLRVFVMDKTVNDSTFSPNRNFYYLEYFFHKSDQFVSTTRPYYEVHNDDTLNIDLTLDLTEKEVQSIESYRKTQNISFEYRFPLLVYYILGPDGKIISAWIEDNRYFDFFPDFFWDKVNKNAHNQIFKPTGQFTYHKSKLVIN